MPISFTNKLGLMLRKTPVKLMQEALNLSEANALNLTLAQLEAHFFSGGNVLDIVNGLIFAKKNNISADYMILAALDLSEKNITEVLEQCIHLNTFQFSTYSNESTKKIMGHCQDSTKATASCIVEYKNPPNFVLVDYLPKIQELLSSKIANEINESESFRKLRYNQDVFENQLKDLAIKSMNTIKRIKLEYTEQSR